MTDTIYSVWEIESWDEGKAIIRLGLTSTVPVKRQGWEELGKHLSHLAQAHGPDVMAPRYKLSHLVGQSKLTTVTLARAGAIHNTVLLNSKLTVDGTLRLELSDGTRLALPNQEVRLQPGGAVKVTTEEWDSCVFKFYSKHMTVEDLK